MVSVAEASSIVLKHVLIPGVADIPLTDAVGRVLAEVITADRDLPPMDRVTMDGIALNYSVWSDGLRKFTIDGVSAAGSPVASLLKHSHCLEVMTGAGLPSGTDSVVPYEDVNLSDGTATINESTILPGQNIHRQGSDAKQGDILLTPGMLLSSAEIALLASVGKSRVKIYEFPRTAIVSSGDELVSIDDLPLSHQVRRSNSTAIHAAMRMMGWHGDSFHMPDILDDIRVRLRDIVLNYDVIIMSGGVSKGKFDYMPQVLEELSVVKRFHRVNQRPGKPFWFGTSGSEKTVFALPGNPVSTYMCFYRYIRPWMLMNLGVTLPVARAILAKDYQPPSGMTYFLQVTIRNDQGKLLASPETGGGSGDFANLKNVSGFLELPPSKGVIPAGSVFDYYQFR